MKTRASAVTAALVLIAARACALAPDEVLVVANATHADSTALARFYAAKRGIDARNVVLIKTTGATEVSRAKYDAEIRDPIRRAIIDRKLKDKIRCLCLLWGVPVRVKAPEDSADRKAQAAVRIAATRMHYRLAVDYKMLGTVGRTFPKPRTTGLKPAAALFAASMPAPTKPLMSVKKLAEDIHRLLALKQIDLEKTRDPARRAIASRQLMAMQLELRGLHGLIDHIRDSRPAAAPEVKDLRKQLADAERRLAEIRSARSGTASLKEMLDLMAQTDGLLAAAAYAEKLTARVKKIAHIVKSEAAVDSELALLWREGHSLRGPAPNPLHWRSRPPAGAAKAPALMAARIDGPTRADAMRIIKASLAVEATGLTGVFYIDAGGPSRLPAKVRMQYDERLRSLHRFLGARTKLKTVLDEKPTVFRPDTCPYAALYVGWYSLKKYVPAFMWKPGSVGWHVASWEAVHLRDPASNEWCVKMIQNGVAATLGAVSEPLLVHFPPPEEFFPLLLTGRYTVAECYWRTVPAASWQMTLIADPLYNPFKANPQVDPAALPPKLAPRLVP